MQFKDGTKRRIRPELRELRPRVITTLLKRIPLKPTSQKSYSWMVLQFCEVNRCDPFDFPKMGLQRIEELTEQYIMERRFIDSPKGLNSFYCAIKAWVFALRMVKSRKLFAEISFDKSSRKVDAITERPLEPTQFKALWELSDINENILLGLYGIEGLRPALIPQLTVSQIYPTHYAIEGGKLRFKVKNPFVFIPKEWRGNKANSGNPRHARKQPPTTMQLWMFI
jgi:hypothetical protein